jgi:hypothetical protein
VKWSDWMDVARRPRFPPFDPKEVHPIARGAPFVMTGELRAAIVQARPEKRAVVLLRPGRSVSVDCRESFAKAIDGGTLAA